MAYGLQPVYHLTGGTIRPRGYTIATGYGTSIFNGDLVELHTDGTLNQAAAAAANLVGVFKGVEYTALDGSVVFSKYWPASTSATNIKAYVFDDPDIVFRVQADQVGTALTRALAVGECCDIVVGSGNTSTGTSGMYVDSSGTVSPTSTQLKILDSGEQDGDFSALGTPMDLLVLINEHVFQNPSAGI